MTEEQMQELSHAADIAIDAFLSHKTKCGGAEDGKDTLPGFAGQNSMKKIPKAEKNAKTAKIKIGPENPIYEKLRELLLIMAALGELEKIIQEGKNQHDDK